MISSFIAKLRTRYQDKQPNQLLVGLMIGVGGMLVIIGLIVVMMIGGSMSDIATGRAVFNSKFIPDFLKGDNNPGPKLRVVMLRTKDCADCFDVQQVADSLSDPMAGFNVIAKRSVYADSADGKEMIEKYQIKKLPTILVTGEFANDQALLKTMNEVGKIVDNVFVLENVLTPFLDVESGQVKGVVSAVLLTDNSCTECYNVGIHESAFLNLQVPFTSTSTVDVGSEAGKELVSKYAIQKVPTVLVSGDMGFFYSVSDQLEKILSHYGSTTDDGTYIFSRLEELGTYRDLKTGKVVEVKLE